MNQQMSQKQLLQWINMVSFAVNDITLYLDTHPDDEEALNYLKLGDHWDWATQPWPWEGGMC